MRRWPRSPEQHREACRALSLLNPGMCIYWFIHMRPVNPITAALTVQRWGNSLAVRIPATIARSAGFRVGQPVAVSAKDNAVWVVATGRRRLTLAQKLAAFDPELHAGEVMASTRAGKEAL